MPVEVAMETEVPLPPGCTAVYPPRKRWNRAECDRLEATLLWNRDRLELIDGELIVKVSRTRPHMIAFTLVLDWLTSVFDLDYLHLEGPLDVSPEDTPTSEPEPDIAVLKRTVTEYAVACPPPEDVLLLIEVSDSTATFDLGPKARLYARARIQEYWVVDVARRRLVVHREPKDGTYSTITAYVPGETVTPVAAPEHPFAVSTAFPAV